MQRIVFRTCRGNFCVHGTATARLGRDRVDQSYHSGRVATGCDSKTKWSGRSQLVRFFQTFCASSTFDHGTGLSFCQLSTFRKLLEQTKYSQTRVRSFSDDKSADTSEHFSDSRAANVDHVLQNDPELKQILDKLKSDFAAKGENSSTETDSKTAKNLDIEADLKLAEELDSVVEDVDDFSFYEVAEDIEEYDYKSETDRTAQQIRPEKVPVISLERGVTGVFELEELLTLLEELGAENVVSIPVPKEANFCDHMVIASAKSQRHMKAINAEMLWTHKRKKWEQDPHLKIEGLNKNFWSAMDLGNIVLHVFLGNAREYYDIESLWTLGPENDPKSQDPGHDPYALSAEDLFWLEAKQRESGTESESGTPEEAASNPTQKSGAPVTFSDEGAGWSRPAHPSSSASSEPK